MIKLFIDIETLPGDEALKERIASEIKPPGNISRPERIEQWEKEEKPIQIEKRYRDTSFDGAYGRILCIGYIREDHGGIQQGVLTGDEMSILKAFWTLAHDVDLFVGFNILDFDLKFIWQRSVVNGVRPSREIPFARYRSEPVFDVMQEWEKWGSRISLDELCRALGVESSKAVLDGSKVYDFFLAGKLQEIHDYCLRDVSVTRRLYEKLAFSD